MPTYAGLSFGDGQQQAQGQWNAAGGGMLPLLFSANQTRPGGRFYGSLPHSSGQ